MDLLEIIETNLLKRFEYSSVLDGISEMLVLQAQRETDLKYKDVTIQRGGYTYLFYRSKFRIDFSGSDLSLPVAHIRIMFAVTTKKMSSDRRNALQKAKGHFYSQGYAPHYDGKIKLWLEEMWSIDIRHIINNEINLDFS